MRSLHLRRWTSAIASIALALGPFALACGADKHPTPGASPCRASTDCASGQTCVDGACRTRALGDAGSMEAGAPDLGALPDFGPPAHVVSVAIDPAEVSLESIEGSRPEQTFMAIVTWSDGTTSAARAATWSLDSPAIGDLDPASAHFVANGAVGGIVTATVSVPVAGATATATARIEVTLTRSVLGAGATAELEGRFGTLVADPASDADLVYPLDGVVMPQNVYPADLQWTRGNEGDAFRITLAKPHVRVTAYLVHSGAGFGNHWLADEAGWRALARSDPDETARITVDRWDAASSTAFSGREVGARFARATLAGSVYYWDIEAGRVRRIDDGTATAVAFMPNPPEALRGERCVGCHVVSPSGRYMVGRLGGGDNIGSVFDLTVDLTPDPAPTVYPLASDSTLWWFSTWSPDETRIMTEELMALRLVDPFTGAIIPSSGTPLPASGATHPAWAPDGSGIAFAANANAWGGAFTSADIGLLPVTGPDSFGDVRILHAGADLSGSVPGGAADAYPTWSPDSRWIAFAHGTGCRSEDQRSALWIMSRDGLGVRRLDRASGGPEGDDSFQPRFSPFQQGGYYWLSFLSRRDYGNAEVGTRGRDFQQIWVVAIRDATEPGDDASEVAYWLPGQATTSRNISAYWAPRPCRPDGESCSVGSECCGGDCRPGADGMLVCAPPPVERCRAEGETCTSTADCCPGLELTCFSNVCTVVPG